MPKQVFRALPLMLWWDVVMLGVNLVNACEVEKQAGRMCAVIETGINNDAKVLLLSKKEACNSSALQLHVCLFLFHDSQQLLHLHLHTPAGSGISDQPICQITRNRSQGTHVYVHTH